MEERDIYRSVKINRDVDKKYSYIKELYLSGGPKPSVKELNDMRQVEVSKMPTMKCINLKMKDLYDNLTFFHFLNTIKILDQCRNLNPIVIINELCNCAKFLTWVQLYSCTNVYDFCVYEYNIISRMFDK